MMISPCAFRLFTHPNFLAQSILEWSLFILFLFFISFPHLSMFLPFYGAFFLFQTFSLSPFQATVCFGSCRDAFHVIREARSASLQFEPCHGVRQSKMEFTFFSFFFFSPSPSFFTFDMQNIVLAGIGSVCIVDQGKVPVCNLSL